ncbi:hypothetical protein BU15DRAFT_66401 [Melanogaster broomeanus]|nr:hypothetical protein BU15DRAFT_66401 [Melanogaster broomeanus]
MAHNPAFEVKSAMFIPAAMAALEAVAQGQMTSTRFFQVIAYELPAVQEKYVPEEWLDIVDIIVFEGMVGFQKVKQILDAAKSSANETNIPPPVVFTCHVISPPSTDEGTSGSLCADVAAWKLVWDWAAGVFEFPELTQRMESFGPQFIHEEWKDTFDAIFEASRLSEDEDNVDLSNTDLGPPPAIKAVKSAMAAHNISFLATSIPAPSMSHQSGGSNCTPSTSSAPSRSSRPTRSLNHKSQRPTKRRKTTSIFLDLVAMEGDEDTEEEEDNRVESFHVPAIEPAGQTSYAKDLDRIYEHYEGGQPQESAGSYVDRDIPIDLSVFPTREGNERIYIIEFNTKGAATFICNFLPQCSLQCWEVSRIPNKIYVEALSPHHINQHLPASHKTTIRDIILLPDKEYGSFHCSWVRIKRGLYCNDIGYVLSGDKSSLELLVVPRQRPYDKIDRDNVPEVRAQQQRERKLFDTNAAKDAGPSHSFPRDSLEVVAIPHPDQISALVEAKVNPDLVHRSHLLFSSQFWKEGDLVRPDIGAFAGQRATILAVDLAKRSVTIHLADRNIATGDYDVPVLDLRRMFRNGDVVKVIAGIHRRSIGTVICNAKDTATIILNDNLDVVVIFSTFLETHLPQHVASLISAPPGADIHASHPSEQDLDEVMLGDLVTVIKGNYNGMLGTVDWISPDDGWMWIMAQYWKGGDITDQSSVIVHLDEVMVSKLARLLTFSKEKGYDVTVGDTLQIVRGNLHGTVGIVRCVDFAKAVVELISDVDGCPIAIAIPLCTKVSEFSLPIVPSSVGRDIWIIGGEKKGFRATLRSLNRQSSVVSLPGYYSLEVKNKDLCTDLGILLDGTVLKGERLERFKPQSRDQTPPHSPKMSSSTIGNNGDGDDAWKLTTDNVIMQPLQPVIDTGVVGWLFDDNFCDFSQHHLSFNIGVGFAGGSFIKHVLLSTTSNHSGRGIEHHNVPARFLTPASPTAKGADEVCLATPSNYTQESQCYEGSRWALSWYAAGIERAVHVR